MTEPTTKKRRHVSGEATRTRLLDAAVDLFAARGVDAVSLREIQLAAGQSNASVVTYHFGSKDGLVQELLRQRQPPLEAKRSAMFAELTEYERTNDARSVVWMVVRPLADDVKTGSKYVALLAQLNDDPKSRSAYWPSDPERSWGGANVEALVDGLLSSLPIREARGRRHQFFNSVLHLLGEHARYGRRLSEVQLRNYVDGWVGLLTAPHSGLPDRE